MIMRVRHPLIVIFMLAASVLFVMLSFGPNAIEASAAPQGSSQSRRPQKKVPTQKKLRSDYSKFSHQTHVVIQKLACNSCHSVPSKNWKEVRKGDAAFPDVTDFPEHASCLPRDLSAAGQFKRGIRDQAPKDFRRCFLAKEGHIQDHA